MKYVNEDEKFWKHSYRVHLHQFDTEGILVNADNEQDSLDYAVDYAEEQGWEGLFMTQDEQDEADRDGEEYITAGNHCRALTSSDYVRIVKVD